MDTSLGVSFEPSFIIIFIIIIISFFKADFYIAFQNYKKLINVNQYGMSLFRNLETFSRRSFMMS